MFNDLNDVKPQKKLIKFKTQLLLALIPLIGWAIALGTSMYNISKAKGSFKFYVYCFSLVVPITVICVAGLLIYMYVILPLKADLMLVLSLILAFITPICMAYTFLSIEKALLKDIKF
ncbi:MAG: hypothetical protein J1G05_02130 [Clostridiales bacterium]|nr:hypothetical protein [Clostridiales bacterium]